MGNQNLDILIQKYINNDMNASEKTAFEKRMSSDEAIKNEVNLYLEITKGVKQFVRNEIKVDLQKAHAAVSNSKGFKKYKPSINNGLGSKFIGFFVKIFVLVTIASLVLVYLNKIPVKHKYINQLNERLHSFDTIFEIKYDTIWKTVPSNNSLKPEDTVYIKDQQELDAFEKQIEENGNEYD